VDADYLAGSIPILFRPGLHDRDSRHHTVRGLLLLGVAESCLCARLGTPATPGSCNYPQLTLPGNGH